jgi:hypothetical protein
MVRRGWPDDADDLRQEDRSRLLLRENSRRSGGENRQNGEKQETPRSHHALM